MIDDLNFYYQVMLFDLKKIRVTYQRMMNKFFTKYIKDNIKIYLNDMVIKIRVKSANFENLKIIFD